MSMASTRAAQTDARYLGSVIKAALMSGVSGFAFGLWRNGLPDSPWMAGGAAVAACVAAYWMLAATRMRTPSMANAAANVRAAVAALPPLARRLMLPSPSKPSPARSAPPPQTKPSNGGQAAAREVPRNSAQRGSAEDERARLKGQGYSDAEISQILIMRETGNTTAKGGFGTGTAAGAFLNNLDAVLAYARHLVPSFKSDLERMFDASAAKADRAAGALSFSLKCAALGVIGYFLYIEAIELKARALDTWAKACISRQQNAINHATMNELMSGKTLDSDDDCRTK
jgi:hypothetical protein